MKKLFDNLKVKLNKDNKGMSIVTVIVAVGFGLILVSILLMATTINFKMRNMNVKSKESFYSAEQVLDEINVGLQQMVSEGLKSAYNSVLIDYSSDEYSSEEKNEMVKDKFYAYVENEIGLRSGANLSYIAMPADVDVGVLNEGLYKFLQPSTRWRKSSTGTGDAENSCGAFLRAKGNVTPSGDVYTGKMLMTNSDGIYLEDLIVYYKDPNGFVSTIETDIHIKYPNFSFDNPEMPSIDAYCFITDTLFSEVTSGTRDGMMNESVICGNSYAYALEAEGTRLVYKPTGEGDSTHIVYTDMNITHGEICQKPTSAVNLDLSLWAGDIVATSSNVYLKGNTYVKDDLNLKGRNCDVEIGGYYTGFGNSSDKTTSAAKESSAILVNGTGTNIDLSDVNKIILSGRAYVSKADDADKKDDSKRVSFYTGESVSAKSNQLLYLVPTECMYALDAAGEEVPIGNPVKESSLVGPDGSKLTPKPDINKPITKLKGKSLGGYLDTVNPVQEIRIRAASTSDALIYYYMRFKDEDSANLFFAEYYTLNSEAVDKYLSQYIESLKMPDRGTAYLAGNIITGDKDTGYNIPGYIKKHDADTGETISEAFAEESEVYKNQFEMYATKLSPSLDAKTDKDYIITREGDNKAVFDNIIDKDTMAEISKSAHGSTVEFTNGKYKAKMIHNADTDAVVDVNVDGVSLIIADCGIRLNGGSAFKGTIIARGKIEVPAGFDFETDKDAVDSCFIAGDIDGVYHVYDIFKDAGELPKDDETVYSTGEIKVPDLIEYSNWSRSVKIE